MVRRKSTVPKKQNGPHEEAVETTTPKRRVEKTLKPKRKRVISKSAVKQNIVILTSKPIELKTDQPIGDAQPLAVLYNENFEIFGLEVAGSSTVISAKVEKEPNVMSRLLSKDFEWIYQGDNLFEVGISSLPIKSVKSVVESLFGNEYTDFQENDSQEVQSWDKFFDEILQIGCKTYCSDYDVQHPKLLPTLRPYQARATRWMMSRENLPLTPLDLNWTCLVSDLIPTKGDKHILFNKYSSCFYDLIKPILLPRGGILADEMGLGKTVITIALILNHTRVVSSASVTHDEEMEVDSDDDDEDDIPLTERFSNLEHNLNSDEKLQVLPVRTKGGKLKAALTSWYESKLAECRVQPSRKRLRRSRSFKCLCGERCNATSFIKCSNCKLAQHKSCTGFENDKLYFCPECWIKQPLVKSAATLIIAPPSIFKQWEREIKTHAPTLNAYMYQGVRHGNYVQPSVLATYDVVITTYATLCQELDHATPNESGRQLRNEERYLRKSSPLTQIEWWRLVCDEAQMFESNGSAVNQMTNLLIAVNKWSVTGTPIQRSLSDLFYLTQFLGLGEFDNKTWWQDFLLTPYLNDCKTPLLQVLSQLFWRSSKREVAAELNIPEQTVRYHFLKFTAIEQFYYMEEHKTSAVKFSQGLRKSQIDPGRTLDTLDKHTLNKLLAPLLNLRQACSHPQAVHGNRISAKTGSATLTELLTYMSHKTKVECEEALRKHISALNGLAGLLCLCENWCKAVECYRKVLRIVEEHKNQVHVDSLQQIHCLTNAAEVVQKYKEVIPPTIRDDTLAKEAAELEEKYLIANEDVFKASLGQAEKLAAEIEEINGLFQTSAQTWWVQIFYDVADSASDIYLRIEEQLCTTDLNYEEKRNVERFVQSLKSIKGLEVTIMRWMDSLRLSHKKVTTVLKELISVPRLTLVTQAVMCHLRTQTTSYDKVTCDLCKCEKLLLNLECDLFATTQKDLKRDTNYEKVLDGAQTKGSWKPHKCEVVLKSIVSVAKNRGKSDGMFLNDGKLHLRLLDVLKKEFKQLRVIWRELNHQVQAHDELAMCKLRFRFPLPGEVTPKRKKLNLNLIEENKAETLHVVQAMEVPQMLSQLESEEELYLREFRKKLGQLMYLNNLGSGTSQMSEQCPICSYTLGKQWCVLQCGHSYCLKCVQSLCDKKYIKCPVCRETIEISEVSYVDLTGQQENSDIVVVGSHSTKIDAVVRTVIELLRSDQSKKILIFSSWPVVLKILAVAFNMNNIGYRLLPGGNHQKSLQEFKSESDVAVLLLPISWGSKGLNLVEATHVFLVEPIMNASEELQAIGRIHRIGQSKQTVVHRFIIRGTIEEKIFATVSEAKDSWNNKNVSLKNLQELFVVPKSSQN